MEKTAIGLLGKQGAGKGTFVELLSKQVLRQKTFDHIRTGSGGIIDDFLEIAKWPLTRENKQEYAKRLRERMGDNFIAEVAGIKISDSRADIVIFDAIRWQWDERVLRRFKRNFMVFIDADKEIRFHRLRARARGEERDLTQEQFEKAELASTEIEIDDISRRADFMIVNNGTIDSLLLDIKFFIKKSELDL